jgi:5-methyltetrahydrofolate--homocysteine methyltransferase
MNPILAEILQKAPVVLDGAWGTQLQARGLQPGECTDGWNLTHPEQVESVAREYVEAGSRIVLTNTFGASRLTLDGHGLGDKTAEINRIGAEISKRAAGTCAKVFASIGPTGKLIMTGQTTEDELERVFREQALALADGGADGIVVETMSDPKEASIAVRAARETGLPVVGCLVFDSGKNKDRTMMGTTPEQAAEALVEAGADVIGSNCGQGIAGFVAICQRLKAACDRPIWIKANAGMPEMIDGRVTYRTTPDEFITYVTPLLHAGASFIGGCCGTNPHFIRALSQTISNQTISG